LFVGYSVSAQENPFIIMATKNYGDYCFDLNKIAYINTGALDSVQINQIAQQMREAAKVSNNKKWMLEADYFEIRHRFACEIGLHKKSNRILDALSDIYIEDMRQIINRAKKINAIDIQLRALSDLRGCYAYVIHNYEMGFIYAMESDKVLNTVSAKEFPYRPSSYHEIGKMYYDFREYDAAKTFYEKGLENSVMADDIYAIRQLWNTLGLIYRDHYKDLDKADSCFLKILDTKPNPEDLPKSYKMYAHSNAQLEYELWTAISKGNLGTNYYLRGNYKEAIPLLTFAMNRVIENNPYNYIYAAKKALTLCEIYLETSDLYQVKLYAGKALDFMEKNRIHHCEKKIVQTDLLGQYYSVMGRYYRASNDNVKALSYADSAFAARKQYEQDFNILKLLHAEQHIKQQQINEEVLRSKNYFRNMIIIGVFASVLLIFTIVLYHFYRQKRTAYKALVIKTQQWAEIPFAPLDNTLDKEEENINTEERSKIEKEKTPPDEIDLQIFNELNKLIADKQLHLNPETTLESVTQQMKICRTYLSQAVNRCTGDNFTAFINEYRIKEAVRLMSNTGSQRISIENIAIKVGFNNRESFYRVFKKITGISPAVFRANVNTDR